MMLLVLLLMLETHACLRSAAAFQDKYLGSRHNPYIILRETNKILDILFVKMQVLIFIFR